MTSHDREPVLTIPRFSAIPFLRHGFGAAGWTEEDLRGWPGAARFSFVFLKQVHSDTVRFIDRDPGKTLEGDALVTNLPGLLLLIRTADCLPVLLIDERKRVVGAVHCGWRGTLKLILERAVRGMIERWGSSPADILAGLGPCISGDCYEVGAEVRESFAAAGFPGEIFRAAEGLGKKYFLDLRKANRQQLLRIGVPPANIFELGGCTHCDEKYHSYRRDRNTKARMISFIGIKKSV